MEDLNHVTKYQLNWVPIVAMQYKIFFSLEDLPPQETGTP